MKTRIIVISLIAIGVLLITSQCNKEANEQQVSSTDQLIQESEAMTAHILAFKEKMEYFKKHPELKSGGDSYSADSAVLEMESLINFDS